MKEYRTMEIEAPDSVEYAMNEASKEGFELENISTSYLPIDNNFISSHRSVSMVVMSRDIASPSTI